MEPLAGQGPNPSPVIDAHSHMWQGFPSDGKAKKSVKDLPRDPRELAGELNRLGVQKVVTFAQEMTRIQRQWLGSNQLAVDLQRHWPEMIIGVAGGEPLDERDRLNAVRLKEVETAIKDHHLHGLLFTPPYGHFYSNDARAYPFYQLAQQQDVPVIFHHAALWVGPAVQSPIKFARPWLLEDVVIDFPDLRMVVEHMGCPWTEEVLAIMERAPNVYTDISALQRRPTVLAWNLVMAREYGVLDRVFWGTDYVGEDHAEYIALVEREVAFVRCELNEYAARSGWPTLSEEEIDGILRRNAMTLYRLG